MRNRLVALSLFASIACTTLCPTSAANAETRLRPAEASARRLPATLQSTFFARHRLFGTEPDFRSLALAEDDTRTSDAIARNDVVTREAGRLAHEFLAFDPGARHYIRLRTSLGQYDPSRNGFPLALDERRGVAFIDPATSGPGVALSFRNLGKVVVVPAPNIVAARGLARRFDMDERSIAALNEVYLELTFTYAEASPLLPGDTHLPVLGHITDARVLALGNRVIHDFGPTIASPAEAEPVYGPPSVQSADVQGLRLGMDPAEAVEAARVKYIQASPTYFYDGLLESARQSASRMTCHRGVVGRIKSDPTAIDPRDFYAACLSFQTAPQSSLHAGLVEAVHAVQFVQGSSIVDVRLALEGKYGRPTHATQDRLVWAGLEPAPGLWEGVIEIHAELLQRQNDVFGRPAGVLLGMELRSYQPPMPRTPEAPSTRPRL